MLQIFSDKKTKFVAMRKQTPFKRRPMMEKRNDDDCAEYAEIDNKERKDFYALNRRHVCAGGRTSANMS